MKFSTKNIGTLKSHICRSCVNLISNKVNSAPHICYSCTNKGSLLEDIKSMNFFELFDLPPNFTVNKEKIYKEYKSLQKLIHPDLIASLNDEEATKEAETISSILSNSYKIILDDYERAKYMLELLGINIENIQPDIEELEYIMDLNSKIEKCTSGYVYSSKDIDNIISEINDKKKHIINKIANEFGQNSLLYKNLFNKNKIEDNTNLSLIIRNIVTYVNSYKYLLSAESNLELTIKNNKEYCRSSERINTVNNKYLH